MEGELWSPVFAMQNFMLVLALSVINIFALDEFSTILIAAAG